MKIRPKYWDNYCMRKFGGTLRRKIAEAYMPFRHAHMLKHHAEFRDEVEKFYAEQERINDLEQRALRGEPVFVLDD